MCHHLMDPAQTQRIHELFRLGYQRPEVQDHIQGIKNYLETEGAILPNSIVIAFEKGLDYQVDKAVGEQSTMGTLHLDIASGRKSGWIVDGQQRVAAMRAAKKDRVSRVRDRIRVDRHIRGARAIHAGQQHQSFAKEPRI